MKTKTFKKGDRVMLKKSVLQRWGKDDNPVGTDRITGRDRAREYSGKVGEVTKVRPNPYPYPPAVDVRFKGEKQDNHFLSDLLEHA